MAPATDYNTAVYQPVQPAMGYTPGMPQQPTTAMSDYGTMPAPMPPPSVPLPPAPPAETV